MSKSNGVNLGKITVKAIKIRTVVPFSFPFSQKIVKIRFDNLTIKAIFETEKREDIVHLLFPHIMPKLEITQTSMSTSGLGHIYDDWSWMSPDRFGQLNYMKGIFYILLDNEEIIDLESQDTNNRYLSKCADVVNLISSAYRVTTREYFPRNYTQEDFMGFVISYSKNGENFENEVSCSGPNIIIQTAYPDDSPQVDVNDIINDYILNIPLHNELLINAEDYLKDKNYRIAIIEADTAVESLISKLLTNFYSESANLPKGEFKEAFLKQIAKSRIDDNIPYIRMISDKITDGTEWANWKNRCHELRK